MSLTTYVWERAHTGCLCLQANKLQVSSSTMTFFLNMFTSLFSAIFHLDCSDDLEFPQLTILTAAPELLECVHSNLEDAIMEPEEAREGKEGEEGRRRGANKRANPKHEAD